MKKFEIQTLTVMAVLSLFPAGVLRAADAVVETSTTTSRSTKKHSHRHKKPVVAPAEGQKTTAPAGDLDARKGVSSDNTDAPGMSDSLGNNNPGSPNMGSSDHVPGTTGTSGQ